MERGQAERLFPLMEEALSLVGKCWQDLAAIGVCTGPGNFTGIRLGVSAARGLSLSLGIPAVGVTMFEALGHDAAGPVLASVDARQDSVYLECHTGRTRADPVISPLSSIPERFQTPTPVCIGHESKRIAHAIGAKWQEARHLPPVAIALIAANRVETSARTPIKKPSPFYIRTANAAPPRDKPPAILP